MGKMENGRWKENRVLRITSKHTAGDNNYNKTFLPKHGSVPQQSISIKAYNENSIHLRHHLQHRIYDKNNYQKWQQKRFAKLWIKKIKWRFFTESGIYSLSWILLYLSNICPPLRKKGKKKSQEWLQIRLIVLACSNWFSTKNTQILFKKNLNLNFKWISQSNATKSKFRSSCDKRNSKTQWKHKNWGKTQMSCCSLFAWSNFHNF